MVALQLAAVLLSLAAVSRAFEAEEHKFVGDLGSHHAITAMIAALSQVPAANDQRAQLELLQAAASQNQPIPGGKFDLDLYDEPRVVNGRMLPVLLDKYGADNFGQPTDYREWRGMMGGGRKEGSYGASAHTHPAPTLSRLCSRTCTARSDGRGE